MTQDKPELDAAYSLKTPDDNRRLYADWAPTYDTEFAASMDYQLPFHAADAFAKAGRHGPVLDVGAGTGLVGQRLAEHGVGPIDGTDISPEMLSVARKKSVYRRLFAADVTRKIPVSGTPYQGIVSAGTFTLGHVGPDALDQIVRIAAPGALFAITINGAHYQAAGFADKLSSMAGRIRNLELLPVRHYGDGATGDHARDEGVIALFRKV